MTSASRNLHDLLADRVRRLGHQPALTYYDVRTGERTELGWATCANWASKTANLLEESDVSDDDEVVIATDGHWAAFLVALGCGLVGARAVLVDGRPDRAQGKLAVVHEQWADGAAPAPAFFVGTGLGGRTASGAAPAFVDDALACEDDHPDDEPGPDAVWLVLPDGSEVTRGQALRPDDRGGRVLLTRPLEAAMLAVTTVLAAGGSVVTVRGDGADLERIAADERCDRSEP